MTTDPSTVEPGDPLSVAQQLFESGDIHHLPVVSDGTLAGIISSSDLLKFHLLEGGADAVPSATVDQVMESNPVVLETGATLRHAAEAFSVGGYHALPVVERDRSLVGIVTTVDLVQHLLRQIARDDGSVREESESTSAASISDGDLARAMQQAKQDGDSNIVSQALLHFVARNRLLEHVRTAAELYIRSGHGEHEHSVLTRTLLDLQKG